MKKLRQASLVMRNGFVSLLFRWRRLVVIWIHLAAIVGANYAAFALRFDGAIPPHEVRLWADWIFVLVFVRGLVFVPFRLYEGLWRYVSIYDARNIAASVTISSVLFFGIVRGIAGVTAYPRSIYILDPLILIFVLCGLRLARRVYRELGHVAPRKAVLVYGAGDAGEMIVRDMRNNPFYGYQPVGFVDDDPRKRGTRIHGVRVLGGRERLGEILERTRPDEVLIAMPRAGVDVRRAIVRALEPFKVPITTLPNLSDLMDGSVAVNQIRTLEVEDLLERDPIDLDKGPVERLIKGRRVLVTGAGGSIGSELCRQILDFEPDELILVERYENGLFAISGELARRSPGGPVTPVIADVCDPNRIADVLAAHRPDIIFHAAAHKHVPLMELNACEAVKNNVLGTRCVARAARRAGVPRFVLISTDKAVNPSSVMGATKRTAEFVVQEMNSRGSTAFITVRFGNVLGSNGSVVPTFLEQIKRGGPVTVTHPDMRRFFMLIPEAVSLVLHAATLGRGGEVFVLQMGEQVKLVDMARNLIRLSGYVPEDDIPIVFTGLRPGEKLSEELVGVDEVAGPSGMPKITLVRPKAAPRDLDRRISELGMAAARGDKDGIVQLLQAIVSTFTPQPLAVFFPDGTRLPEAALAGEAGLSTLGRRLDGQPVLPFHVESLYEPDHAGEHPEPAVDSPAPPLLPSSAQAAPTT